MSDRYDLQNSLRGPAGELVFVRLTVPSRLLEDALEALAEASFPVNPEIRHSSTSSAVEFPAYDSQVKEISSIMRETGLVGCRLEFETALAAIR